MFFIASAALLLCSSWSVADEQCAKGALPENQAAKARTYLARTYPTGDNPGVSVLVACDGETLFAFNNGMANIEWRQPISSSTSFRLGSISKPLTAVAILQLAEQGKVELDAPIADYVPLLPQYMRPVTVRQLMNHTSGLPDILLTPTLLPLARDWVSIRQVIEMQANTPPRFASGERFDYFNFNYVLLAALIEAVTDTAHVDYMDNDVFQSLGLTVVVFSNGFHLPNTTAAMDQIASIALAAD